MTVADDSMYLMQAVDNLIYGLKRITDTNGNKLLKAVQGYPVPIPTVYPCVVLYPGGGQIGEDQTERGIDLDGQLWTIGIRYYAALLESNFSGSNMYHLWLSAPLIMNYLNRHPDLVFSDTQADDEGRQVGHIEALSPIGVRCRAVTRFGRFQDAPEHLGMEYALELPFELWQPQEMYYDEE